MHSANLRPTGECVNLFCQYSVHLTNGCTGTVAADLQIA